MRNQGCNSDGVLMSSMVAEKLDPYLTIIEGPSLTRQEWADECDINTLMAQYDKTGVITHYNQQAPAYLDLTETPYDLQNALDTLNRATAAFMSLPASVRKEFDNDAAQFVNFAQDPENLSQMRTWGLAPPEAAPPAPQRVEIVNPAPAAPPPAPVPAPAGSA